MKKFFSLLIILSIFCGAFIGVTFTVKANALTEGYYTYTVTDGKATIIQVSTNISGDITVPSTLGGYPVKTIGTQAFQQCVNLTGITVPNGIERVNNRAFSLLNIKKISFADSVTFIDVGAVLNCSLLETVKLPANITKIPDGCFESCDLLKSITIPSGVTSIGNDAFNGCYKLENLTLPYGLKEIGNNAFSNCETFSSITIPNTVTTIGDAAFLYCYNLTQISLSANLKNLGAQVFDGCLKLKSITIPSGVTKIGDSLFRGCEKLSSVKLHNNITYIGYYAFCYTAITNISIPSSVTSIQTGAFGACENLTAITIPKKTTMLGEAIISGCHNLTSVTVESGNTKYYSKGNCIIDTANQTVVAGCKTSVIPDGIKQIGDSAFSFCSFKSFTIPDSVHTICAYSFQGSHVETLNLGKGVKCVELMAFEGCNKLRTVNYNSSRENAKKINDQNYNRPLWQATWVYLSCENGHTYGAYKKQFPNSHIRECSVCGVLEENNHSWDNGKITLNSNCSEQGEKTYTCTYCSDTKVEVITYNPSVHKFDKWTVSKKATCTESGKKTAECSLCHQIATEVIEPLGHNVTDFITSIEPSCTKEGVKIGTCSRCGLKGAEQKIPVLEHSFGESVIIKPATNNEEGLSEKTCSSCGFKSEEILPKLSLSNNDSNTSLPTEAPPTPDSTNTPPVPDNKEKQKTAGIVIAIFGTACVLSCGIFITVTVIKRKNKK